MSGCFNHFLLAMLTIWLIPFGVMYICSSVEGTVLCCCYYCIRCNSRNKTDFKMDQSHKSNMAYVPYTTMHHSEQKLGYFCSELVYCAPKGASACIWQHRPKYLDYICQRVLCSGTRILIYEHRELSCTVGCHNSLLASLYNPIVNPAMVSTVRFYDRNELYGSPDVRNCRMPNF